MIWFFLYNTLNRALIELNGTIIESERTRYHPDDPYSLKYFCTYIIKTSDGEETIQYVAHGNDITLARDLPVGTKIEKRKWEITYKINGEIVEDFNLRNYRIIGCIGFFLVMAGLIYLAYLLYLRFSYGD